MTSDAGKSFVLQPKSPHAVEPSSRKKRLHHRWGRLSILTGTLASVGCASGEGPGETWIHGDGGHDGTVTADGETAEGDVGEPCRPWSIETSPASATPTLMFVLDKSGSMREAWDHDEDPSTATVSRWWSLRTSLDRWATNFGGRIRAGVQLFPAIDAVSTAQEGCIVSSQPELGLQMLDAAAFDVLPDADAKVYGATPATVGFRGALASLVAEGGESSPSVRAVVLVTDGAANCRAGTQGADRFDVFDDELELAVSQALADHGIPTYVVGVDIIDGMWSGPSVNPHEALSSVALAGGVPRPGAVPYYAVSGPGELDEVLDQVTQSISCTLDLGDVPVEDRDHVTVRIDGMLIPRVDTCAPQEDLDGWRWTDDEGQGAHIELCGAACQAADVQVARQCGTP